MNSNNSNSKKKPQWYSAIAKILTTEGALACKTAFQYRLLKGSMYKVLQATCC